MKTNSILQFANDLVKKLDRRFFDPATRKARRQAALLCSVVKTRKFHKMATHEKITAVARLVSMFERDYGYAPVLLTQTLLELNAQLNSTVAQLFTQLYS